MKIPQELQEHLISSGKFVTGKALTFSFLKNTIKAPKIKPIYGDTLHYNQDIEPTGFYCLYTSGNHLLLPDWVEGIATVNHPLVIRAEGWKKLLNKIFNAKQKTLTTKLLKAGFDAIIPFESPEPMEIVLLKPETQIHKEL